MNISPKGCFNEQSFGLYFVLRKVDLSDVFI